MRHYLRAYEHVHTDELSQAQARAAVGLAGTPPGGAVLDAPCGAGRHSRALFNDGYRVTGVDSAGAMLAAARSRAAGPRWVRADYRDLPFAAGSFDTVLNLFTSFGFGGDDADQHVLQEFRRVLRPDGRLVLDTTHRDRVVGELSGAGGPNVSGQSGASTFDVRSGWLHMTLVDQSDGHESISRIRIYTPTELSRMLTAARFRKIDMFGGLDGRPLGRDTRLVIVAG